ncbi:hypothetical protein G5I_07086 [Acromyrmex echinatior]|uniref:Uncharacterized protein n=1 Tax=Acromyrmex echinatior TaxID=103372 RepID=F4WMV1_ACREC|nr:hypothetical protein G5I_07086 [Acromyrmex echinatior]
MTPVLRDSANVGPIFWIKELNPFDLELDLVRSQETSRNWSSVGFGGTVGLAMRTVPLTPPDIRSLSPFSNGRTNAHYNPKDKTYGDMGMNQKEWQGDLLIS